MESALQDYLKRFCRVIGKMLIIRRMTHPDMLRTASYMASKTYDLRILHSKDLLSLDRYANLNDPHLYFAITAQKGSFHHDVFWDGASGSKKSKRQDAALLYCAAMEKS